MVYETQMDTSIFCTHAGNGQWWTSTRPWPELSTLATLKSSAYVVRGGHVSMMQPWPVLPLFSTRIYCAGACCEVCVTMP